MSWEACIAEIRAAAGAAANLSDDDIERLLQAVMRRARRKAAEAGDPNLFDRDSLDLAARELADEARLTAAIERRNAALNMLARVGRRQRIEAAPDPVAGVMTEIHGINTPVAGGRYSAEGQWQTQTRIWQGEIILGLEREGLLDAAKSRVFEREWTRELFELSKGRDGNPGVTGSPEALQIAEIVHRQQAAAKQKLNRAGAWIGGYAGYIARTSHDPDKIRLAGGSGPRKGAEAADQQAWKDFIRPLLDERTFDYIGDEPATRERFLDNIYAVRAGSAAPLGR